MAAIDLHLNWSGIHFVFGFSLLYVGVSREGIGFGTGMEPLALAGSGVPFDFHSPKPMVSYTTTKN